MLGIEIVYKVVQFSAGQHQMKDSQGLLSGIWLLWRECRNESLSDLKWIKTPNTERLCDFLALG